MTLGTAVHLGLIVRCRHQVEPGRAIWRRDHGVGLAPERLRCSRCGSRNVGTVARGTERR
jgi:hypothetical protein